MTSNSSVSIGDTGEPRTGAIARRPFYYATPYPQPIIRARLAVLGGQQGGRTCNVSLRDVKRGTALLTIAVRRRVWGVTFTIAAAYGVLHADGPEMTTLHGHTRFGSAGLFRAAQVSLLILMSAVLLGVLLSAVYALVIVLPFALAWLYLWTRFQRDRAALLADIDAALRAPSA
ncbi:MAG: hypothetical protein AAF125_15795 [Chloroflexota bacterium]